MITLASCVSSGPTHPAQGGAVAAPSTRAVNGSFPGNPAARPTFTLSQPTHEYVVYGVKTVAYAMSGYEASQTGVPLYQYIHQHTDIYRYSVDEPNTDLLFSDATLPVFIMNTSGGGETAIHDIVAVSGMPGKLYARMMPRDHYTSYLDAGSLYELSLDGDNTYRKLLDFPAPVSFTVSPDATRIAYLWGSSLFIRSLDSGSELARVALDRFQDNSISTISWGPDGKTILMDVQAGEESVTPQIPYAQTNGCYLVHVDNGTLEKLTATPFLHSLELAPGLMTDPFSYSYFPRSDRLMGIARKYQAGTYSVRFYVVDLQGSILEQIPVDHGESVWEAIVSLNEDYVAYPCLQGACLTGLEGHVSQVIGLPAATQGAGDEELTLIGWLEK